MASSYKHKKNKKIKNIDESYFKKATVKRCLLILDLKPFR